MRTGIISYRLPLTLLQRVTDADAFQLLIQSQAQEVDFLPGYSQEMVRLLWDYLATEYNIGPPSLPVTFRSQGMVLAMNRHHARVLRNRLQRITAKPASSIFHAYGKDQFQGGTDWAEFLTRQHQHISTEEEALVLAVVEANQMNWYPPPFGQEQS